ncbi:toll/interleukin-1 receptor-like protein [Pistacia vera]|uniref:toll/interleukin-1 receptor-like protein n=1 Tax=Pistacia vera TaxID=55513 RepID=UPI001262E9A2|nr:toll/interleukin-1 receptor-like protein [Pistacia vera]
MASSSISSPDICKPKYDVFLSFRGEDTRDNFTSHLYAALCQKQIQTFIDDGLQRGEGISPALITAIEESRISVIIFSKDYASSRWCLNELVKILECKQMKGQTVIPIFYQVDPSDVRKQSGNFRDAFVKRDPSDVLKWKTALTEAANLSGWNSMTIRPESKLIDGIVKDILKKLDDMSSSSISEGLVGMDSHIKQIKSLLSECQIVGIWGMGGIGKTTIAEASYNQISRQFEGHCFIANVVKN